MQKNKKWTYMLIGLLIAALLGVGGWHLRNLFESEKPVLAVQPLPSYLAKDQKIIVKLDDSVRGLRSLKITLHQQDREMLIHEEKFSFVGLTNKEGVHHFEKEVALTTGNLQLNQGQVELIVEARDFSRRESGMGNQGLVRHTMLVDTTPPSIRLLSQGLYVNRGGTGLVIYQADADTASSGVFVNEVFFSGFPAGSKLADTYLCYFSIPPQAPNNPDVRIWAKDIAGNENKTPLAYHLRPQKFRQDKLELSDSFLNNVLPYFSFYLADSTDSNINKFLKVNLDLRKENHAALLELSQKSDPARFWEGTFLRMQNSKPMASFADRRFYYYQGKKVDEQIHWGVDLASLSHARVEAANNGRVIFADRLGIYGNAVVIDHGQGLNSLYGHMSKIEVQPNQDVKKGDLIGYSGQTGLAGGDHLHFSVLVNGVFVDPKEWWDEHWIQDNITSKLQ